MQTPSHQQNLKDRINAGLEGKYTGLSNGFDRINNYIFGTQRKVYYLLGGMSGCLAPGTKVVMYSGQLKKVEDVIVGDLLMGPDSKPREVLELYNGEEQMYWIRQNKGEDYMVNSSHILSLKRRKSYYSRKVIKNQLHLAKNKRKRLGEFVKFEEEVINVPVTEAQYYINKGFKGYKSESVEFESKHVTLDPYFLGLWLGDGTSAGCSITNTDPEIIDYLYKYCTENNLICTIRNKITYAFKSNKQLHRVKNQENYIYSSVKQAELDLDIKSEYISRATKTGKKVGGYKWEWEIKENKLLRSLKTYNLLNNKHIPDNFKYNSRFTRLKLLAGILDSDGHKPISSNAYIISSTKKQLTDDIVFLSRSLGFYTSIVQTFSTMKKKDGTIYNGKIWRISIYGNDLSIIPVRIPRKKCTNINKKVSSLSTGIQIEKASVGKYYGFNLSGDHLFLLEDFTVTHNTYKTTICDYWIQNTLLDAKKKGIKCHLFYASYEIDELSKKCNWLSTAIYHKYNIVVSPEKIKGFGGNRLTNEEQELVYNTIDEVEEMMSDIHFIYDSMNPTGLYYTLWEYMLENGKLEKEKYSDENGTERERIIRYVPNNPEDYFLWVLDHAALQKKERGYETKEVIDKWSEYAVQLRNIFGMSGILVQQFNMGLNAVDRQKYKGVDLSPAQNDFKDSTNPYQDADVVIGLMNPYKLDMNHCMGYDVQRLNGKMIQFKIIKNRLSTDNIAIGLYADPKSGTFSELPRPEEIKYDNYKNR